VLYTNVAALGNKGSWIRDEAAGRCYGVIYKVEGIQEVKKRYMKKRKDVTGKDFCHS
jgi:hypothetical protein